MFRGNLSRFKVFKKSNVFNIHLPELNVCNTNKQYNYFFLNISSTKITKKVKIKNATPTHISIGTVYTGY